MGSLQWQRCIQLFITAWIQTTNKLPSINLHSKFLFQDSPNCLELLKYGIEHPTFEEIVNVLVNFLKSKFPYWMKFINLIIIWILYYTSNTMLIKMENNKQRCIDKSMYQIYDNIFSNKLKLKEAKNFFKNENMIKN